MTNDFSRLPHLSNKTGCIVYLLQNTFFFLLYDLMPDYFTTIATIVVIFMHVLTYLMKQTFLGKI